MAGWRLRYSSKVELTLLKMFEDVLKRAVEL